MTEYSTNNDINKKSHLTQPLQNSHRHFHNHSYKKQTNQHLYLNPDENQNHNSPQHYTNLNKHLNQNENNKQQAHSQNSSANISNIINTSLPISATSLSSPTSSTSHSPLHYRNPLNSPNNSPFACAYYGHNVTNQQQHQKQQLQQQQQQQQHYLLSTRNSAITARHNQVQNHFRSNKLALPTQRQYQQHLNDLLLQQQQLQQHQQQLLIGGKDTDDELSEESLKQNVAIVLNNLDRYNNALRSIILNEQVNCHSSVYYADLSFADSDIDNDCSGNINNNFLFDQSLQQQEQEQQRNKMATAATPESDYNSNPTTPGARSNILPLDSNMEQQQQHLVGFGTTAGFGIGSNNIIGGNVNGGGVYYAHGNNVASNNLNCSLASSHDFTHDNSDYQWFLDYGYRDGCSGLQRSVLSSFSTSYNCLGDLIYYEDLAKNIDANLAEVDMESFRAEDIHSLLSQLPTYCKNLSGGNGPLQLSFLTQNQMLSTSDGQNGVQNLSQTSTSSTNELIDNSICKSELLFSPVKESHISVDSLDIDAYPDDGDIILTCKANKDNYTIAFEGSVLYSDESFYEPIETAMKNKQNFINLHSNLEDIVKRKSLAVSMSRSDQAFTIQNKLQKSNTTQLQRYPSGNNNTMDIAPVIVHHSPECTVRKSYSLPNLRVNSDISPSWTEHMTQLQQQEVQKKQLLQQLNVSQTVNISTMDCCRSHNLLPMCQMPISCNSLNTSITEQGQLKLQQQHQQRHKHRCSCANNLNTNVNIYANEVALTNYNHNSGMTQPKQLTESGTSGNSNPSAFSLVKRFIKQKSNNCSFEDSHQISSHTCMDISSGCWPSSGDAAGSSSSLSLERRLRKKSMNDSGKGSALSRHDEEEYGSENEHPKKPSHAAVFYDDVRSVSSSDSLTATNPPAHRRRSVPLRHLQTTQLSTAASSEGSRTNSDQLTQMYAAVNNDSKMGSEMVTRSMQTSSGSLNTRSNFSDRFRCVPPSFLAKLNNLGEERQAPIYVIYPNYALPDLGFVKSNLTADVIFSPFNYKVAVGASDSTESLKKRANLENEMFQNMDYKHVEDWSSLVTLLPAEYRRRLKHIPEVNGILRQLDAELSQRPFFCMAPSIRRNRAHICDCAQYLREPVCAQQTQEASSSSGSSQQPSSGYRGSSTLLTDSDLDTTEPLKQMYVYQYEQQRMESGIEMTNVSPSQPIPRGILRKSASQTRNKRNSMIENQQTNLSKLEKRRSLQEPPYRFGVGSSEELGDVFEEEGGELYTIPVQPRKERLSRKELDAHARARAESFLSSLPRSELKHYVEIASILECEFSELQVEYDAAALKKEVSRALSQQKKVSFDNTDEVVDDHQQRQGQLIHPNVRQKRFSTPPNSPNHSLANVGGLRIPSAPNTVPRRCSQTDTHAKRLAAAAMDKQEKRKIEGNRFKRLQIQWELMSKDSSMLKELASVDHTKSGGSTPTSALGAGPAANAAHKSRIPRPVSYPAGKCTGTTKINLNKTFVKSTSSKSSTVSSPNARISSQDVNNSGKNIRSPSRIVPPKRYSMTPSPGTNAAPLAAPTSPGPAKTPPVSARARTPTNRIALTAPNTPKRRVQSPRTISRVR